MRVSTRDGAVVVGVDPTGPFDFTESLTPLEAERVIKELRRAIDALRAAGRKPKKLGEY